MDPARCRSDRLAEQALRIRLVVPAVAACGEPVAEQEKLPASVGLEVHRLAPRVAGTQAVSVVMPGPVAKV